MHAASKGGKGSNGGGGERLSGLGGQLMKGELTKIKELKLAEQSSN